MDHKLNGLQNMELVKLGDSLDTVCKLLGFEEAPTIYDGPAGGTMYHFVDTGFWIFFDKNDRVRTLRYNIPYSGKVNGIAIGDSKKMVRSILGKPDRRWPVEEGIERWIYDRNDFVRYDFNPDTDLVETIFK